MEFIRLNHTWNADPVDPDLHIEINGFDLKLSFYLNAYVYEQFNEGDMGVLEFRNCFQYRLGAPNDEGFYIYGDSRYSRFGVKWGEFYLVKDSDWKTNFPEPKFINTNLKKNLNHYLFYMKDETFECIAENYTLNLKTTGT